MEQAIKDFCWDFQLVELVIRCHEASIGYPNPKYADYYYGEYEGSAESAVDNRQGEQS